MQAPRDAAGSEPSPGLARKGSISRVGFWLALVTAGLTVVTFALALTAIPNDVPYPFANDEIARQWPRDYLWMYAAMPLMLLFVALTGVVHALAPPARQPYSLIALCIATIAAAVLLADYFIQVTVMQPSLEKRQLDGYAMLTQYNPNGVFLALEELGYLLMSLSLVCVAPAITGNGRRERAIRWLLIGSFVVAIAALVVVSAAYGIDRGDRFEIAIISIVWLTLIAVGPLLAVTLGSSRVEP